MNIVNKIKRLFEKEKSIEFVRPAYLDYAVGKIERYKNVLLVNFTNDKVAVFKILNDKTTNKEFLVSVGYLLDDNVKILACSS